MIKIRATQNLCSGAILKIRNLFCPSISLVGLLVLLSTLNYRLYSLLFSFVSSYILTLCFAGIMPHDGVSDSGHTRFEYVLYDLNLDTNKALWRSG